MNLDAQRALAWEIYQRLPAPSPRDSVWQRFDLRALPFDGLEKRPQQVRVSWNAPEEVVVTPLADQPELGCVIPPDEPNKFATLVSARWQHGVFLRVPAHHKAERPVEIAYEFYGHDVTAFPRTLVLVERGAEATVIQRFVGNGSGLHAALSEIRLETDARLHCISLQNFGADIFDFSVSRAHVAAGAEMDWVMAILGGRLACWDAQCVMTGERGRSFLYGLAVGSDSQQIAQFTRQHHRIGNTTSDLLFKNVLRDHATSSYRGIIKVEKNANGTNAYQANRNLVLDPTVRCDSQPILEIESNQLRCTHGATVGRLDDQQLYYLRTRGLDETEARNLLIEAFLEPVLARIRPEPIRNEFTELIHRKAVR